ncbi:Transcription initiation factor TFIID subunit 11 [Leucoagaricus sp. SymC.cos]|nr:Transcription initiation factor TFIID subunit 11 [Leucoagaricus sp. SymC.cos]
MTSPYPNFSTPLTFANTTVQSPAVPATPTPAGRGRPRGGGTGAKRGRKPKNALGTNSPRVASPAPGSSTVSPITSAPQYQHVHWTTNTTGDDGEGNDGEGSLLQGGISRRNSSQSQVIGAEQGDGATAIASPSADGQTLIASVSGSMQPPPPLGTRPVGMDEDGDVDDESQTLIPSVSGSMQPPPPLGTRPVGMDEDGDVDDELLPAMADDDYSAQQSWNTQSKDNLKILMDNFTPEQYERFEAYRRHALPKQAVRKVIQQSLGQQVSQPVAQIIAGFSKVFVARAVQARRGETGPLAPDHLREAYRMYQQETGRVGAARPLRSKRLFVR